MADPAVGPGEAQRIAFALDLVRSRADLNGLRVLDLACCHGAFATAFADAGANVLGIEGRQGNLDHAPSGSARYELGDVRDLSAERHGTHDVTLCLGILYHLGVEDALRLFVAMREVTERFAVIDTHIGTDRNSASVGGYTFRGSWHGERVDERRSSIGNPRSWWFTPQSLHDALRLSGWTDVEVVDGQGWHGERSDRRWLIAA